MASAIARAMAGYWLVLELGQWPGQWLELDPG